MKMMSIALYWIEKMKLLWLYELISNLFRIDTLFPIYCKNNPIE